MKPISIQLYSVRNELTKDFAGTLKKIADIGYKGVEPAGFYNNSAKDFKKIINDLGMEIYSSHTPWVNKDNINEAIDTAGVFGIDIVAMGYGPDDFKTMDAIKATAEKVNTVTSALKKAGISAFLHNHFWEFEELDGKLKHHYIAEMCPDVKFEIDTYWATNFGAVDPAKQLKYFGDRTVLLHIKDGCFCKNHPNLAVGSGKMDFKAIFKAAPDSVRAFVVEFDSCATDLMTAVKASYDYLISNKFAEGNK